MLNIGSQGSTLPFELKLKMPSTDRGGRGYSDEYVAKAVKELQLPD